VVTTSDPGGSDGRIEQRIELGVGEERDERLVKALGRDRENALDRGGVLGVLERRVFEQ